MSAKSLAIVAVAGLVSASQASIVTTSGAAIQISPPASCIPGALVGPTVKAWNEKTGISVSSMAVDIINNPSTTPGTGFGGNYTGIVDSHFLHFDFQPAPVTGTVLFNSKIVGVMFGDTNIDLSDVPLGVSSTIYPNGSVARGWNTFGSITISGPLLTFVYIPSPLISIEQIRVITDHVPTPGTAALLGLGGMLAVRRRRAR